MKIGRKYKKMNKKGIFVPTLVVVTLVILIYAYVVLTTKGLDLPSPSKVIGEVQLKMVEQYQRGEEILLYVDQAAKHSGYKAADDLGENGGFYNNFPCDRIKEYTIWQLSGECNPVENLEDNFKNYFNKNLNVYLRSYPGVKIPVNNYEYTLKILDEDLEITGLAKDSITTKVAKDFEIEYAILPSFKQKIKYSLSDYQKIIDEIKKEDTLDCLKRSSEDLKNCLWERYEFEWKIKKEGDIVKFDVGKAYLFKPIIIKFAINLTNLVLEE